MSRNLTNYDRLLKWNKDSSTKIGAAKAYWITDKAEGYVRGVVMNADGDKIKLKMQDGEERDVIKADCLDANPAKFDGVKDCADLSYLNDASVLHNLRVRYNEDLIHTYSGLFLVVVNPYKWIKMYTPEIIEMYRGRRRNEVHPHVYAVGDEAYRHMLRTKRNQSILITGESGAGKTENTKKVIQYLATIAGKASQGGKLEEQILQVNPMLEAFGNAKTNKNDNSSRFGKFIRIQFNAGGIICGTKIEVYLLEKSRVVYQGPGERGFHIFYQLPLGATAEQKKRYSLGGDNWGYRTHPSQNKLASMDDVEEWKHTIHAMEVIGLDEEEEDAVFKVIAGIMHCGNLEYKSSYGSDGANIANADVLQTVADLWGVDAKVFEKALVKPRIKAGRSFVEKHLDVETAKASREALCKSIYERVFLWLVQKLNLVLEADRECTFIGVLDIAGFEIFEFNSFEQLCINFTNEKLQQFFNDHMFKLEQEEYAKEKIDWTYIDFGVDSAQTIALIEKKPNSVLSFLDEESIFPNATSKSLIAKLNTLGKKNPKYQPVKFKDLSFAISHYAGDVPYDVTDWITKNKDPLQNDIAVSLKASTSNFISTLFTDTNLDPLERMAALKAKAAAARETGTRSRGSRSGSRGGSNSKGGASFMTVSQAYKAQLLDLMTTLRATHPSFIRCIIPNLKKQTHNIVCELMLEQLACNGVLEGIKISRKGYPNRVAYGEFVKRYYLLHDTIRRNEAETKDATKTIMDSLSAGLEKELDENHERPLYQFGMTKAFFRHGVLAYLEEAREKKLGDMVVSIQSAARAWIARSAYKKIGHQTAAAKTLQKNLKAWIFFKDWMWWKLFILSKPLLSKVDYDGEIKDLEAKAEKLEDELEKINSDKASLKKQIASATQEIDDVTDDLDAAKERISNLEKQRSKLDDENAEFGEQIDELEDKLNAATKAKLSLETEFKETNSELAEAQSDLEAAEEQLKKFSKNKTENQEKIDEHTDDIADLEDQQKKLKKQLAELEADLEGVNDDAGKSGDKSASLEKELASLQLEVDDLHDELEDNKRERSKLESAKKELESSLKDTQEELESENGSKQSTLAKQAAVQGELDDLNEELETAEKKNGALTKEGKKLAEDLADAEESLKSAQGSKSSTEKKGKALQAEVDELQAKVDGLEEDKSSLESNKKKVSASLTDLEEQIEDLKSQQAKLKKAFAAVDEDLNKAKSELEEAESSKSELERKKKKLVSDIKSAEDELDEENTKKSDLEKNKSKLEKQVKQAEEDLEDAESKKTSAQGDATKLKSELSDVEGDLESAQSKKADAQRKKSGLEADLATAKEQLESEQDEKSRAEKAKKQADAKLADIQGDVEELTAANKSTQDSIKKKTAEASELSSGVGSDALADAQKKWSAASDKIKDEKTAEEKALKAAQNENKSLKSDLESAQSDLERELGKEKKARDLKAKASQEKRERDAKIRETKREVDTINAATSDVKNQLAAAKLELESLKSLFALVK